MWFSENFSVIENTLIINEILAKYQANKPKFVKAFNQMKGDKERKDDI